MKNEKRTVVNNLSCARLKKFLSSHITFLVFLMLYSAFIGVAFRERAYVCESGAMEIWGWDYQTFVRQIQDWQWIGYFGFRHPGLGVVNAPLVALEHIWSGAYLLVMPAVAVATTWLIWKMSGWIGWLIWLSFPTVWILAGLPESFPFAQLTLVASFYWLLREKNTTVRDGRPCSTLVSGLFVIVNTMVTLTNGIKPVFGWLVLNWRRMNRKMLIRGGLAILGGVMICVFFFAVRSMLTGRGVGDGFVATLSWIQSERDLPRELYGFFIRPVGLWQSMVVYPIALYGIVKMIRCKCLSSILLLTSYFIVDLSIHLVIGWGMNEPWVFAPHWVWMLPLLVRLGIGQSRCLIAMKVRTHKTDVGDFVANLRSICVGG